MFTCAGGALGLVAESICFKKRIAVRGESTLLQKKLAEQLVSSPRAPRYLSCESLDEPEAECSPTLATKSSIHIEKTSGKILDFRNSKRIFQEKMQVLQRDDPVPSNDHNQISYSDTDVTFPVDEQSKVTAVCRILEAHEDWELRQEAAWSLGKFQSSDDREKVVPALSRALCQDEHFSVRTAAATSLGKLRDGVDVLTLAHEHLKEKQLDLVEVYRCQKAEEKVIALRLDESSDIEWTLCEMQHLNREISHALEQCQLGRTSEDTKDLKDWEFRQDVARFLGKLKINQVRAKVVPVLIRALCQDEHFTVRRAAESTLAKLREGADILAMEFADLQGNRLFSEEVRGA